MNNGPARLQVSSVQGKTQDPRQFQRDTRNFEQKIRDFFLLKRRIVWTVILFSAIGAATAYNYAWSGFPLFFLSTVFWMIGRNVYVKRALPIRLPASAGVVDHGDPSPGHAKYNKSRGIFFLGNSKRSEDESDDGWGAGEEFWVGDSDMRRHFLVFGSTGSGKTITLVGFSYNALAMGSGLIYIDPKADAKLVTQIYKIARFLGREEDVRVLNFMTGNRDQAAGTKRSNTVNPFAFGDATTLSEILTSMIPASEGDNAIFSQRAIALIKAIMPPLVEMRDRNERLLSVETIREFLSFDKFVELGKGAHQGHFSDKVKSSMAAYLASLGLGADGTPTSQKNGKPDNQKAVEQFQYATMYFTRAMDSLATDYGYIYNVVRGEVDYRDVFFNRRILVVLLPALEKNETEIALLGKLVLFAIKNALASGLGSRIEGSAAQTLGSRPSSSNRPMLLVLDEYAALQVKGFAEAATQGRSLGASCVFANQDLAGFKKASDAEADQILANTRCQIFMYQGDMNQTMDYIVKKCGQAAITKTTGYAMDRTDQTSMNYSDKLEATLQMENRAVAQDWLKLTEGEYFLVFDDRFVVGTAFFDPKMEPKDSDVMRVNRLLMINPPEHKQLELLASEGESLYRKIVSLIKGEQALPKVDEARMNQSLREMLESSKIFSKIGVTPVEEAISVVWNALTGFAGRYLSSRKNGSGSSGGRSADVKGTAVPPPPPEEMAPDMPVDSDLPASSSADPMTDEFEGTFPEENSPPASGHERGSSRPVESPIVSEPAVEDRTMDVVDDGGNVPLSGDPPSGSASDIVRRLTGDPGAYDDVVKSEAWISGRSLDESRKVIESWIARALEESVSHETRGDRAGGSGKSKYPPAPPVTPMPLEPVHAATEDPRDADARNFGLD